MSKKIKENLKCALLEFLGVFFINLTTALSLGSLPDDIVLPNKRIESSLSVGTLISFLTILIAPISGGHFNPALTIPLILTRDVSLAKGICYIVGHFLSSIFSCIFIIILDIPFQKSKFFGIISPFPSLNSEYCSPAGAFVVEFSATMFLTLIFYTAIRNRYSATALGVLVGMAYVMAGAVIGFWTGGSMNPARTFGFDLMYYGFFSGFFRMGSWAFYFGPVLGALFGAFLGHRFFNEKVNVVGIEYMRNRGFSFTGNNDVVDVSFEID